MAYIRDITAEEFDDAVMKAEKPLVIEFWVRSCDQCRRFKPVYERLPEALGEKALFLRMNMLKTMESLRLAEGMGVEQTPTTKVFCSGSEVGEIVGYLPFDDAVERLKSLIDLC
ncbi:hypothetical protein JXL21_13120 [Candidatus Bathyarchaeota archaeon]|nr:hypothetical protein [Candidatus Bathyarchaeota archaeon]